MPFLLLVVALPGLALSARRLHDTGRSGWFLLFALVPVGASVLYIILLTRPSQSGTNRWGPRPGGAPPFQTSR